MKATRLRFQVRKIQLSQFTACAVCAAGAACAAQGAHAGCEVASDEKYRKVSLRRLQRLHSGMK